MQTAALLQADPRVANIARQIRAQQKIVAPKGIVIPDAYIDELAKAFVRRYAVNSVTDIKQSIAPAGQFEILLQTYDQTIDLGFIWVEEIKTPIFLTVPTTTKIDVNVVNTPRNFGLGSVSSMTKSGARLNISDLLDSIAPFQQWYFDDVNLTTKRVFTGPIYIGDVTYSAVLSEESGNRTDDIISYNAYRPVKIATHDGFAIDDYDLNGILQKTTIDLDVGNKGTHVVYTLNANGNLISQVAYKETSFIQDFVIPATLLIGAAVGLPAILGEAILGAEIATAYPAVSSAVGSAVVQTALTGELNIERAVINAAAGVGGAEVGAFVQANVDSAAAGAIAAAATTAALSGRDIGSAVAKAALFNAGGLMDDDYVYDDRDVLVAEDIELFSGTFTGPAGDAVSITGELVEPPATEWANGYYVDSTGAVRDITNRIVIPAAEADKLTDGEIGDRLYSDWMLQQATVVATQPGDAARPATIRQTAPQTKVPTITDAAKTFDSLLKTGTSIAASVRSIVTGKPPGYATSATGRTTPPVVGVPVRRPDGSIVTNVGNGMQRIQYPDGRVETVSSAAPGGALLPGLSNQTLLIGGAILVGALLLARRK